MADWNLVRQSKTGEGAVVFGPTVYDVPLLPFEKELIKTIGITEEEYRKFTAEVRRKGIVRPASYSHVPEILNTGEPVTTSILISLAVGLVFTGVAYLLMPKPKQPDASKREDRDLGDVDASDRFTPSSGFDTLNELANYNAPIPIIFGLYNKAKRVGGMLVTPKLVWSRMLSHGTQQSAKLMFVVGEQGHADGAAPDGIKQPDLEGIFLGNNALDGLFKDFFAFYWKNNSPIGSTVNAYSGYTRLRRKNFEYGTSGSPESGDPGEYSGPMTDVFECPGSEGNKSKDFCHAFSPVNSFEFGVYGAIPNGNGYRVNHEVVSIIDNDDTKAARQNAFRLTLKRIKITGAKNENPKAGQRDELEDIRKQNQDGEGRQYSPRMGIVKLIKTSGATVETSSGQVKRTARVAVDDQIEFRINPTKIPEDKYLRPDDGGGEYVEDINSTVASEQIAADEALQLGEQFAIGNTRWVVIKRKLQRFDPDIQEHQTINLKCIGTDESRQSEIGIVSVNEVINPDELDFISDGFNREGVDPTFYPITKIAAGIVRNNKPAIVTEIGIRSKVFQNLGGLCAFNTVPTPEELEDFDDEEVVMRNGLFTGPTLRTSVFQIYVRKAGVDNDGNAFTFERIDQYFAVRGSKAADQYNFIRFIHPDNKAIELEYKFVGVPGSELRSVDSSEQFYMLSAAISATGNSTLYIKQKIPGLGELAIESVGYRLQKKDIRLNREFLRKPVSSAVPGTAAAPDEVRRVNPLPNDQNPDYVRPTGMTKIRSVGNLNVPGRAGAFFTSIFGNPDNTPGGEGTKETTETRDVFSDGWIRVRWTVQKLKLKSDHYAVVNNEQEYTWNEVEAVITGSSAGIRSGDTVTFKRGLGGTSGGTSAYPTNGTNPFVNNHPDGSAMTYSGYEYEITEHTAVTQPEGRAGGYYHELFFPDNGYASDLPVGYRAPEAVERSITNDAGKKIRVRIFGKVVELRDDHWTGLKKRWDQHSIEVVDDGYTTTDWEVGDPFQDAKNVSASSNPYFWSYDRVGFKYEVTSLKSVTIETSDLSGETEFEGESQYADMSFYRGLVQKSNESEPEHSIVYVNEILPNTTVPEYEGLTLCGLSLKASRNFTSLDQLRCWLGSGISVKRLHPDYASSSNNPYGDSSIPGFGQQNGPSNLFSDLVYYLLTDITGGAGNLLGMNASKAPLLNLDDFANTSRFLAKQRLFFNGVIAERTNLRQYIADTAPSFLCHFVINNGKFSLQPAVPYNPSSGNINIGRVQIDQLFTSGNILEDSYRVEYLRNEERRLFKAVVRYRFESKNKLPEEKVMEVSLKNTGINHDDLPEEQFDLSQYCTSREHAKKAAQYFLGLRKLVTHTINFSTTVHGLNLKAGSYIKVATTSTPYSSANNGTISAAGAVTSVQELDDGTYNVTYYKTGSDDVEEGLMQVSGGRVADSTFHNSVFTISNTSVSENVYVVEQLTFSEEGTVDIVASEHPCDSDGVSELAKLVANSDSVLVLDI